MTNQMNTFLQHLLGLFLPLFNLLSPFFLLLYFNILFVHFHYRVYHLKVQLHNLFLLLQRSLVVHVECDCTLETDHDQVLVLGRVGEQHLLLQSEGNCLLQPFGSLCRLALSDMD